QQRGIERLRGLNDAADAGIDKPKPRLPMAGLPQVGQLLVPGAQDRVTDLRAQLLYAGYYAPHALHVFLAVKLMLVIGGALLFGLTPYLAGLVTWERSLIGCL